MLNVELLKKAGLDQDTIDRLVKEEQRKAFEEKIKKADLLITGEGKIDRQTFYGKPLHILFNLTEKYRIPTIALCGTVDEEIYKILNSNLISIMSILPGLVDYKDAMKKAKYYLRIKTEQILKILKCGKK